MSIPITTKTPINYDQVIVVNHGLVYLRIIQNSADLWHGQNFGDL